MHRFPSNSGMHNHQFYVYILTNLNKTVLYTGVTNNLEQRIIEHWMQRNIPETFAGRYAAYLLLHFECFDTPKEAIVREKEIKGWSRAKKMKLINQFNPELRFLNKELFGQWPPEEISTRW